MICGGRGRRVPCFFLWGQKIPQRSPAHSPEVARPVKGTVKGIRHQRYPRGPKKQKVPQRSQKREKYGQIRHLRLSDFKSQNEVL